jgi:hypothetical protein
MNSNCENIITPQLKIDTTYELKFPKSSSLLTCKLITKHNTTKNYEILYTFIDNFGNKVKFTNSVFKNMIVNEYIEPPIVIEIVDKPTIINWEDPLCLGLPSDNKNIIAPIISINSYINQQKLNLIVDDDDLYS